MTMRAASMRTVSDALADSFFWRDWATAGCLRQAGVLRPLCSLLPPLHVTREILCAGVPLTLRCVLATAWQGDGPTNDCLRRLVARIPGLLAQRQP